MDIRRSEKAKQPPQLQDHVPDMEALQLKRVRLLASLTLLGGIGLILALPFALRAGAEFFLPVTAALVVAIALVPMLEWFERRGVPSKLAAGLCVLVFLAIAIFALMPVYAGFYAALFYGLVKEANKPEKFKEQSPSAS